MRVVIQRVENASVSIEGTIFSKIEKGMLILLGIHQEDTPEDVDFLVKKISKLRIFSDENGQMNKSIADIDGEILVVSQFTLYADTSKGNRPSFFSAARPEIAIPLYKDFIQKIGMTSKKLPQQGLFGADMRVHLCNDGPVTIILDSQSHL
jgi:D-tyrosyl-tRNA(Tyr) deacylase